MTVFTFSWRLSQVSPLLPLKSYGFFFLLIFSTKYDLFQGAQTSVANFMTPFIFCIFVVQGFFIGMLVILLWPLMLMNNVLRSILILEMLARYGELWVNVSFLLSSVKISKAGNYLHGCQIKLFNQFLFPE